MTQGNIETLYLYVTDKAYFFTKNLEVHSANMNNSIKWLIYEKEDEQIISQVLNISF